MWDRLVGLVIMARGVVAWFWPFMVAIAVTGNIIVLVLLVDAQADSIEQTRTLAEEARKQTVINRQLIERGNPCLPGDDPASLACEAKRASDARLAHALAAVQDQHDEQGRQLAEAVARLIELQERVHGVGQ